jgi:hypothetical protein
MSEQLMQISALIHLINASLQPINQDAYTSGYITASSSRKAPHILSMDAKNRSPDGFVATRE